MKPNKSASFMVLLCHNKCFYLMMAQSSTIHGSSSVSCTLYPCFMSVPYQGSNTVLRIPTGKSIKRTKQSHDGQVKNLTLKKGKLFCKKYNMRILNFRYILRWLVILSKFIIWSKAKPTFCWAKQMIWLKINLQSSLAFINHTANKLIKDI